MPNSFNTVNVAPLLTHRVAALFLLVACTAASWPSYSQTDNDVTWYQVEIIVFRQGGNPKQHVEQWVSDIELDYPLDWQVLVPAQEASDTPDPESPFAHLASDRKMPLLPSDMLTLRDQVSKLNRSNWYRILFHGGWQQPFPERGDPLPLILEGGLETDGNRELSGSIKLRLQRYLHIETDLWLTDYEPYTGQEAENWPDLPKPPYLQTTEEISLSNDVNSIAWQQWRLSEPSESLSEELPSYLVSNLAVLRQKRRMRSNELHYIDHPLMGVLIQFTPMEAPPVDGDTLKENNEVNSNGQ